MRSAAGSGAGVVPEVRRGGAHTPGGDPQLAHPSNRTGRRDRALPGRVERRAGLAGGQHGELAGKRSGRLRNTGRDGSCGGSDKRGDELHSGRTRDGDTHDDERHDNPAGDHHVRSSHAGRDDPGHEHPGGGPRGKHHTHDTRGDEHSHDEHPGGQTARDEHRRESQGDHTAESAAGSQTPSHGHGLSGASNAGGRGSRGGRGVVGAGAAGLYTALCAAREGGRVALISAAPLAQTASYWAQGGLAAALAEDDSPELHLKDTERAGRGATRRAAAEVLVAEAPECVARPAERWGCASTRTASGAWRWAWRGATRCAGWCTRVAARPAGACCAQLSALAVEEPRVAVLENVRAGALWQQAGDSPGSAGGSPRNRGARAPTAKGTAGSPCGGVVCWPIGDPSVSDRPAARSQRERWC